MERRSGAGEGYALQGKQDEWEVRETGDEER